MLKHSVLTVLLVLLVFPIVTFAHTHDDGVGVRIVSDSGEQFPNYRTYPQGHKEGRFFYLEAVRGQKYSIEVTNRSGTRIGVVIAVDGRNIINGKKSELKQDEQMYIIGPFETNSFEGWRTGLERTNRFYFTEQSDSYAEKVFADASAMGTIALAVYREKIPEIRVHDQHSFRMKEKGAESPSCARDQSRYSTNAEQKKVEEPGTGFGETTYSPARVVQFDPEPMMAEKVVLKYEWRSELCRKGIISCGPKNRFWPEPHEFAPIPKDFNG